MTIVIQRGHQPYETVIVIYYDTLTQQLVTQIVSLVRENVSTHKDMDFIMEQPWYL